MIFGKILFIKMELVKTQLNNITYFSKHFWAEQ